MVRQRLSQFLLYRWRYLLAYTVFSIALGTLLIVAGFYLPGGLSDDEVRSALISEGLNPSGLFNLQPDELIYLPYRLLQAASIALFGFSTFAIKLPSIVLGFFSALGILYLLNLWYKQNVAIVAAMIAVTTNQFLLTSQAGQAGVTYVLLTTLILIAASMIARRTTYAHLWVIGGFVLAAISLYMPLNIYILVALMITAMVHPHARHLLKHESSKLVIAIGSVLFLLIISPLVIGIINEPEVLRILAGIPENFNNVAANAKELFRQYGQVYAPYSGEVLIPIYGVGILSFVALGIYRMLSTKYTTKSYIMSFWLVLLIPLVFLNPEFVSITFLPVVLLIALGIDYLIWSWYRLFPRNPYARVFGLIPLAILLGGQVVSNVDRYAYGFHYDASVYRSYSFDLSILSRELRTHDKNETVSLVVSDDNKAFYEAYARHQDFIKNMPVTAWDTRPQSGTVIVERTVRDRTAIPTEILVGRASHNADRFYLYKSDVQ